VIEVNDDGPGPHGPAQAGRPGPGAGGRPMAGGDGSGKGIIGMTERAHALAGTLEAGPRLDGGGGFRVRACLPLNSETPLSVGTGDSRPAPAGGDQGGRRLAGEKRAAVEPAGGSRAAHGVTASHRGMP
jgi:hypothetical protein